MLYMYKCTYNRKTNAAMMKHQLVNGPSTGLPVEVNTTTQKTQPLKKKKNQLHYAFMTYLLKVL